ncbi:DUF5054 domain-containing protein [Paenibacillus nasutitermitis]|uniref:DUF5054 domain-containing protein n=1 Tax=Paenibacillus nasutitermitis TaxID=1652958 RepID=A0A916YSH1_9BACL|nr:DUF5054 domain-containing protein [Paenibacillus nasutitermitis]GGD59009.1 hypothetical protein GCM10010911_16060 [Paenibacillus nasutitermitis]
MVMNEIKTVHVVFKTHLDIGFTDLARNVLRKYKEDFIPKALSLSEELNKSEEAAGFIWTTGSWLIQEYLADALPDEKERMERAIQNGHIAWHGLPFTTHTELLDSSLFQYGLSIADRLDKRYGKKTISAKMTDVPGHTRSMIPHMSAQGIQYLHLGVNPASKVPSVPSLFVWKAADGSDLVVNYADNYGNTVQVPGLQDVLYFAHTGDNNGPPSIEAVREEFDRLRERFPGALVQASTMDAFAEKLLVFKHTLPVLTEEIGDSWIHGAASDPTKIARFREMQRIRTRWLNEGRLIEGTQECDTFSNYILLVAEHTWGMDEKTFLGDYISYTPTSFARAREKDRVTHEAIPAKYQYIGAFAMNADDKMSAAQFEGHVSGGQRSYSLLENSWQEQRNYLEQAIHALAEDKQQEMREALQHLKPQTELLEDGVEMNPLINYKLGLFQVTFGQDGSINHLIDHKDKIWADENHVLGSFFYESFGMENYHSWFEQYVENTSVTHSWSDADFGKPGMENALPTPRHQLFSPKVIAIRGLYGTLSDIVKLELELPIEAVEQLGAPRNLKIEYTFSKLEATIAVTLNWYSKQANRLPESIWFSFAPLMANSNLWKMSKMGQLVSPLEVVKNGNRNLHAVETGVHYQGSDGMASIETFDAPVLAMGERRILQFDNTFPSLEGGIHVLLYNNVWGTNFPMWFGEDSKFRFQLMLNSF